MLSVLRRIIQEVNAAPDFSSALQIIVKRIRDAMNTDVSSVYLLEPETNRFTLMATEGLNQDSVGRVSLAHNEGIVGLVGTREEPINLADASNHPKFCYLAETGEDKVHAFLGVPIIYHRNLLGVLVVQQAAIRNFDESEEAFLVTVSAQLASVIAHAEATGNLVGSDDQSVDAGAGMQDARFEGVSGAPGVSIGTAVVVGPPAELEKVIIKPTKDVAAQIAKFDEALVAVRADINRVGEQLSSKLSPEEQALFDVYLRMLDDNALGNEVKQTIESQQINAPGALKQVIQTYIEHFEEMEDEYLRERGTDIKDLGRRVLAYLIDQTGQDINYPDHTVLVSEEITPTMLGEVPEGKLAGIVSVKGASNSHVAILARAMGIPTVMGVVDIPYNELHHHQLIVDGYRGFIFNNPSEQLTDHYRKIYQEEQALERSFQSLKDLPSVTTDNHPISLWVNTGLLTDVVRSLDRGAEGVGLYRTEVPFMMRDHFPSEQIQTQIYRQQLEAFAPMPVTMRTLDIGGDKALPYFPIAEDNPFLGWRGIRVSLDHPEIFLVQVRAMLIASEGLNNLRIMLPMVSTISEVEDSMHLIYRAFHELIQEGHDIQMPSVGVMIEVPAAVYQAREIAKRVDFISVGSNDLTQYLLAVDRNNSRVASLYDSYHPAVLLALYKIAEDAHHEGIPVSICGEIAGEPGGALLLMAMGYDVLSMNATNLLRVKAAIRHVTLSWSIELLETVLAFDNGSIIKSSVDLALKQIGLEHLVIPASAQDK